ncbi:MAG: ADP-L-glycero-D-mannoheptose-6-epimerase, partial [Candidatus Sumerlaeota bacterium]
LARAIFAATAHKEVINWIQMPPALIGKYQYFTQADAKKLRAAGYAREFTSLENAVADYVKWMKEDK